MDNLTLSRLLNHYKRKDVQKAVVDNAKGREVAIKFGDKGFGKRPDILKYPGEVLELVKQGATSFHISEERWTNPLDIVTGSKREVLDSLRSGWDLIIDIDCHFIEYSKLAADLVIKALKHNNVKSVSCKFSGNKGFHIGVPFEAFPEMINNVPVSNLFPEAPRKIAAYLTSMIMNPLTERILNLEDNKIENIVKKTGLDMKDLIRYELNEFGDKVSKLNVESFLEIDTLLISSRHLYRSVYSFNEKSGLVSIPIIPEKVLEFKKADAEPENVKVDIKFLDTEKTEKNEAAKLFIQSFDFQPDIKVEDTSERYTKEFDIPEEAVPEKYFPPCIKNILKGLTDGRKRSLFILRNFLKSCGWSYEQIEQLVKEWNARNTEELKENVILGQLRYGKGKKAIPPPNCANNMYYKDIRVCTPDNLCSKIKNPLNYVWAKKGK